MTNSRMKQLARRSATTAALLTGVASIASAQSRGDKAQNVPASKQSATSVSKADKAEDKAEHKAVENAKSEPKALKGIKLTKAQKAALKVSKKRFSAERKDLEKQEDAARKSGHADPSIVGKLESLRLRERAEIREALTPAQRAEFDRNEATHGSKKS